MKVNIVLKNIKKLSEISNEIKTSISNYNSNDSLNSIEKNLNKLESIDKEYSDISEKFTYLILDINELMNELEYKFGSLDYEEINFDEIDESLTAG